MSITIPNDNKTISTPVQTWINPAEKEAMKAIQAILKPHYGHVSLSKIHNILKDRFLSTLLEDLNRELSQ